MAFSSFHILFLLTNCLRIWGLGSYFSVQYLFTFRVSMGWLLSLKWFRGRLSISSVSPRLTISLTVYEL